jgi:hypothetical protein
MVRKYFGPEMAQWVQFQKSESPQLFVWFRGLGTNAFMTSIVLDDRLADQAGNEAGVASIVDFARFFHLGEWTSADFLTVPRRSRVIRCNLYTPVAINSTNSPTLVGSIHFPNPAYGRFPQWQPEPLPTIKKTGNVEVRLDDARTGHLISGKFIRRANGSNSGLALGAAKGGEVALTELDVSLISPADSTESWVPQSAELSDATGNFLNRVFYSTLLDGEGLGRSKPSAKTGFTEYLPGTLWPDEPAWRLRLEIKRAAGFAPEEFVVFKNVPVAQMGSLNDSRRTNVVGGVQLVLTSFARSGPQTNSNVTSSSASIYFDLPGRPAGVAVDVLKIITDGGQSLRVGELSGNGGHQSNPIISLHSIPTNAQTVDITFIVQKTRTVEFLVKPPKPE